MEDNPYIVVLDPQAFHALYTEIAAALESEPGADAQHTNALQRSFKAIQEADERHVCVDERAEAL